jgi:hypothetical protein
VEGANPQQGNDVGGPLRGLVMHGASPESSGAVGPGISGLLLLGSPGLLPQPIN